MATRISTFISRPRRFVYPNPNKLRTGYWTIASAPFFPILRINQLAQSNCPKKMNFMYLCGTPLNHIPENYYYYQDPQGNNFPFGYRYCSEVFNKIIVNILSGIRYNNLINQAIQQNPDNNPIWDQILRDQIQNELGTFSILLYNDLLRFFSRLYLIGENRRYYDHPEHIFYRGNIFSNKVFLDPSNHQRTFTFNTRLQNYEQILDVNLSWTGSFPLYGTIDAIDFENKEIIEYFYFREDFLTQKPDWTRGTILEDNRLRHEYLIYHTRYHQLWLSRLALMNLEPNKQINFDIRLAFQSVFTPNYPQFLLNDITNSNDWLNYFSSFKLRLDTIDNTFYPINDYTNDTVGALAYTYNSFMQKNWENEFLDTPCFDAQGRRDMYCNFYNTCRRRRNAQIIPRNYREEVFGWQCALKDHLTLKDEFQYCIAEFLPRYATFFLEKNQLWIGKIINFNNNIIEIELNQRIINILHPNKNYLIIQWTPFFYFPLYARCRRHQNPRFYYLDLITPNEAWRNWFDLRPGNTILILDFDEESKRNDLLKQRALYELASYHPRLGTTRGQLQSPSLQQIRNARLNRGGIKASEATYGGGVRYL